MNKTMMNTCLLATLCLLGAAFEASAQIVHFTGVGRALVTNEALTDTATASQNKGTGGYTMFDLGIHGEPSSDLRGSVVLRLRNEFGGFFGDGSSFEFREMKLEGIIKKSVYFEIGDIDLEQTPYTLHNFDITYHDFESDLFEIRRNIVNYENFYHDNQWRMQGVHTKGTIAFPKVIDKIELRAYGARVKPTDFLDNPDRLLAGAKAGIQQSKHFNVGLNYISVFDVQATLPDSTVAYRSSSYTTDIQYNYEKEKFILSLLGETGFSNLSAFRKLPDHNATAGDYFYDAGFQFKLKTAPVQASVSYKNVGYEYSSPGAQTRRIYDFGTPEIFPVYNNEETPRTAMLLDRLAQEKGMYNRSIQTSLIPFRPEYNNMHPYGTATPNRKGLTVKGEYGNENQLIGSKAEIQSFSEIEGEGTPDTRSFFLLKGGLNFNIYKLLEWNKTLSVGLGVKHEQTKRGGTASVDLSSLLIDAGLQWEVIKDLEILGGYKAVNASGNEFLSQRNPLNPYEVTGFVPYNADLRENIIATGFRYSFSANSYFVFQSLWTDFKSRKDSSLDYRLNQLFFNFNLEF